jgi:hypothetical protein
MAAEGSPGTVSQDDVDEFGRLLTETLTELAARGTIDPGFAVRNARWDEQDQRWKADLTISMTIVPG